MVLSLFFLASCTTKYLVVDSSYIEGCEHGIHSVMASLNMVPNPYKVTAYCQELHLRKVESMNLDYEVLSIPEQPQI